MSDYEVEYNGLTLTCDGEDDLSVRSFAGLGGPEIVQSHSAGSALDGHSPDGPDRLPIRQLVFEATIVCADGPAAQLLLRQLVSAWQPIREGLGTVRVRLAGVDYEVDGRPGKVDADIKDMHVNVVRARLSWLGLDPRLYQGTDVSTTTLGLTPSGGFVAPITFPYVATSSVVSLPSDAIVTNAGGFETHWTAVITGPVTNPKVSLAETGQVVELTGDLAVGDVLVLDSRAKTIRYNGSPRPGWLSLSSTWWLLPAGASTVRFRASAGTGELTFTWRSAWL